MQNPIKRFFNSKKLPTKEKLSTVNSTFTSVINGLEHFGDSRGLKSYEESLYVFAGVYMVMQRVASIPLELYRIKNKQGDVAEIFDDPLLEVLSNPNEIQSRREFFELSVAYYLLAGDCFWYLERVGSKIVSIVPLRPDYVQIVLSTDAKRIIAYEYSVNTIQRFRPEDVIHIKTTNPVNSLRGLGIMRTASTRIATEIEATNNQVNWFKNQGRPDIIVFAKGDPSQEERDRARAAWQEKFGGSKSGSVAFLGEQYERIEMLNKTPQELGFIESKKSLRDDIFMVLRIPKPMYTSDDVNLANAKEGNRIFIANAVMPVLDAFIDVINHKLITVGDVAKFFTYTDPTPMDREALLKETTELKKNGIITANEARALYNYEAMEGADDLSTQSNMPDPAAEAQMKAVRKQAKAILRSRPVLVKKLDAIEALTSLTLSTHQPKRSMSSVFPNRKAKEAYAKAYNDAADRKAAKVKEVLDGIHAAMEKRILATDLNVNAFMDVQAEKKAAKDALTPVMVKMYQDNGQEALDALFRKSGEHFFTDAVLMAAIEGRVDFFTNSIMDTTFEILKSRIVAGVAAGNGPDKIAADLREYFADMSEGRAKTIAQTETNFVLSKSSNDAFMQSSVVTGVEWLSVGDDKVREDHVENEKQGVIAKGAAFQNGEAYPAEHSVNCRCVLLPAV